jgi:hypothetical protein
MARNGKEKADRIFSDDMHFEGLMKILEETTIEV